jgi:hypothetical protein
VVPLNHAEVVDSALVIGRAATLVQRARYAHMVALSGGSRVDTAALVDSWIRAYRAAGSPQLRSLAF